ncbi:MAG: bacillithiol system redox-active protein YtxJ [Schleiferiaceae bacterium]|nr:bacillithiol system redox-active protein YtxJ [Schleiferiaceae bacterium]
MPHLESVADVQEALLASNNATAGPVFIYKHSSRCFISKMTWQDIRDYAERLPKERFYFVDVVRQRDVSNYISKVLSVVHESPQLLKVENGKCTGAVSHERVSLAQIKDWDC